MTPFFSVIVPVYNVRSYLDECVNSVLSQDMADYELLLVDDCSSDGSAQMLERYDDDDRVVVVRLPRNVGLGGARNAGMKLAKGEYLMFLDSDDALASGSLRRIHDRILETDKPDVLVFDYARWYEDGTQQRNPLHELVGEASRHGVFNLVERPNLLDLFNSACSKAYRREFTEWHAMTFPTGYYEDIPWTMVALMAAERIAALDAVVLLYRQRLAGSILRSRSRRHFDVFAQWELVFRYLDHHPECEIHRQRLYTFMISQFDAMLVTHARVPDDARAEFFHLAVSVCHANRPEPWVRHIRPTEYLKGGQLRLTALDRGNFALFEGIARSKPLVDRGKEVVRRLAAGRSRSQSTADEDSGRA